VEKCVLYMEKNIVHDHSVHDNPTYNESGARYSSLERQRGLFSCISQVSFRIFHVHMQRV